MAKARVTKATMAKAARDGRRVSQAMATLGRSQNNTRDSYQNFELQLGMGTGNALATSTYGFNPITRVHTLLEWIHRGSWLGGVAVDLVADDMTRAGIEVLSTMDPKDLEKLDRALIRLGIWSGDNSVNAGIKWGRLYGGAIGVFLVDGQRAETPLNVDRIGKNGFRGLLVLDRWMCEPSLNDLVSELGPHLGQPKYYRVTADSPVLARQQVHYSRIMRFNGIGLPYWQRLQENLWGESVIERLYDRMVAFDSATQGAAQSVYKSHIRTYKMKGLHDLVAEGGDAETVAVRYVEMMRRFQGVEGITLLDAEDDMVVVRAGGMEGIGDALIQFGQQLAGALQIPLVRLFGQSPAGLNSTGESDLRTYYDGINQQQEQMLRTPMERILRMTALSEGIQVDDDLTFRFRPLWQLTEAQKSEVFARDAETLGDLEERGILPLPVVLRELRQSSRVTGRGSNITDEMIDEAEAAAPDITELIEQTEEDRNNAALAGAEGSNGPDAGSVPTRSAAGNSLEPKDPTGPKDRAWDAGTSQVYNAGIAHLARGQGAWVQAACKTPRAHMIYERSKFAELPEEGRCQRCQATFLKWEATAARRGASQDGAVLQ